MTHKKLIDTALAMMAACTIIACNGQKVYDKYEHTPITGWEKNDTLVFDVSSAKTNGTYMSELGLRINESYPFMGLTLIVEQRIMPADTTIIDTLKCNLTDRKGNYKGTGVLYYQYNFHVAELQLQQGDSLHICVRHDMKREILPGISDVGMKLTLR